jgi:predicted GNAT family acetyltransferase
LFTPHDNVAAQRAYEALGYEHIGEYGLVLFEV